MSLIGKHQLDHMVELARQTPIGLIVEVGVYKGGSAERLMEVAKERGVALHLYDTFTGIPERSDIDRHNVGDFKDVNLEEVKAKLSEAVFHIGVFPDTLTDDIQNISFIHVDADQYETTNSVIKLLWPRLNMNGIIYFDDKGFPGIVKAIEDNIEIYKKEGKGNGVYALKTGELIIKDNTNA